MTTASPPAAAPRLTDRDPMRRLRRRDLTLLGATKRVYVAGSGPAVIVMTEMPGIYPHVARFARWVRDAGFTVWMPASSATRAGRSRSPSGSRRMAARAASAASSAPSPRTRRAR